MKREPAVFASCLLALPFLFFACTEKKPADQETIPIAKKDTTAISADADGIHEMRDKDGMLIMKGPRINGKREGEWESYFPDGTIRSQGSFQNGIQNGTTSVYHENGALFYTGNFSNGITVGEWNFYDPDGTHVKIVLYDDQGVKLEERDLTKK